MQQETDFKNTSPAQEQPGQTSLRRDGAKGFILRAKRSVLLIAAGALILFAGGWWLVQQFTHVYVNDARIAADMLVISSRVPGWITGLPVNEGSSEPKEAELVAIDSRDSRLKVQQLEARLAGVAARKEELLARSHMIDRQTASRITARRAAVKEAEADLAIIAAQQDFAQRENRRAEELAPIGGIDRSRLDQTRTSLKALQQKMVRAAAALDESRAALAQAESEREEIKVLEQQQAELGPEQDQLQAELASARLDVQDRVLTMPFAGVIDRVFVEKGEYVMPGQRLMMVHNPNRVRVEANVKETDIRYFKLGSAVTITIDSLPGQVFSGQVESVGQAATSEFALLPNPNPSGNFTKIAQRLPVRVSVEQHNGQLKPGMMAELVVSAHD